MRKHFKKIICMISVFVFAFCPLLFSGCDTTDVDPSGNTTKPSYKVNDYLSAMKVAYTPALNSSADDEITSYANEVLGLTEILAVDTLVNLLENYYDVNKNYPNFTSSIYSFLSQEYSNKNPITLQSDTNDPLLTYTTENYQGEYVYSNVDYSNNYKNNTFQYTTGEFNQGEKEEDWLITKYLKGIRDTDGKVFNNNFASFVKGLISSSSENEIKENSVACRMMYAILKISNIFYNVTNDGFESAYDKFKKEYEQAIDSGKATIDECRQLAITSKHSGLIHGDEQQSSEQRAFKQYILDYIIGEDTVKTDNSLFEVWDGNKYVKPKSNEKYTGEYYYFNTDLDSILNTINTTEFLFSTSDIERYSYTDVIWTIYKGMASEDQGNQKLRQIWEGDITEGNLNISNEIRFKLWQDFNNDGVMDIDWAKNADGGIAIDSTTNRPVPKYRATSGEFRNYDWTVEQIVNNVLSKSEIIYNAETANKETIEGYPTVSNVFSRDYEYSAMEISSNDLNAKYTCSLPRNAYKSIVICAKDRSDKDIKNNIGFVNMVLESAQGVSVDVKIYARYYRSGSGYAKWDSKISNELDGTLYPLVDTLKINGPYKVDLVDGQIQDSSLEINVQEMFKKAKFNDVENSKKFDFTYTDSNNQSQTKQIYEIEPFVDGYYNTSINKAVHASVFGLNGKTNPRYNSFTLSTGETIYSYDNKNLDGEQSEYGYLEILFVPSNENAFTFGLLGYVPENEFSL